MLRALSLALLLLASGAIAPTPSAQAPTAEAVVALQALYGGHIMGQGVPDGLDEEIAATGAPEAVQAFFRAGMRGADLLDDAHLRLPARETLEVMFAVDSLHQVSRETDTPGDVAEAALAAAADHDLRRLASTYYRMLFVLVGNKVRPFDLSAMDFTPLAYTDDPQLAAVFYLEAMRMSQSHIWGLINVPSPPNFAGAAELIAVFPQFDGQPYYAYTNVDPGAFLTHAGGDYQPYRDYYIDDLYETLLYHVACTINTTGSRAVISEVVSRSIISRPEYHAYFEDPGMLAVIQESFSPKK